MEILKGQVFIDRYSNKKGEYKFNKSETNNQNTGKRVYEAETNLLNISPIVFDCLGNENDKFLTEWEIAYSGDTFLITLELINEGLEEFKSACISKYFNSTNDKIEDAKII